jgi:hypothetical protein
MNLPGRCARPNPDSHRRVCGDERNAFEFEDVLTVGSAIARPC